MSHPTSRLDQVVHQPARLGILTILAEVTSADFTYLRDTLEVPDGSLSRHLQVLEQARYIKIRKSFVAKRPRTTVSITALGRSALDAEVAHLAALVSGIGSPNPSAKHEARVKSYPGGEAAV